MANCVFDGCFLKSHEPLTWLLRGVLLAVHFTLLLGEPVTINGVILSSEVLSTTYEFGTNGPCRVSSGVLRGNGTFSLLSLHCSSVEIVNVSFVHGTSRDYGGCLLLRNVTNVTLSNVIFEDCHARLGGGAIAVFPFDHLVLSVTNSVFSTISTTFYGNLSGNEPVTAVGAAMYAFFAAKGSGSEIKFSSVLVDGFAHAFTSSIPRLPSAIGGAFFFYWPNDDSGHSPSITTTDVTFRNGTSSIQSPLSSPRALNCTASSLSLLLLWGGALSGHGAALNSSGLVMESLTFLETADSNAVPFGLLWNSHDSGHNASSAFSRSSLTDCHFGDGVSGVGLVWIGPNSGSRAVVTIESSFRLVGSSIGANAYLLGLLWWSGSSGEESTLKMTDCELTIVGSVVGYDADLFAAQWLHEESGKSGALTVDRTTMVLESVVFDDDASVLCMGWYRASSGALSSLSIDSSSFSLRNCSFGQAGSFVNVQYFTSLSGQQAFTGWRDTTLMIKDSLFGVGSSVFFVGWEGDNSGEGSKFELSSSAIMAENCSFLSFSSIFALQWEGKSSGDSSSFEVIASPLVVRDCDFGPYAGIWLMTWNGDSSGNDCLSAVSRSRISLTNCSLDRDAEVLLMEWGGSYSGSNASLTCEGSDVVFSSVSLGDYVVVFVMVWYSSSSGDDSRMLISSSPFALSNAVFSANAGVARLLWVDDDSGQRAAMTWDNCSVQVTATYFSGVAFFANMLWNGDTSGSDSVLTVVSGSLSLEKSVLASNAYVFWVYWSGKDSGLNALTQFCDSSIHLSHMEMGELASIVVVVWSSERAGNDSSFVLQSTPFLIESSVITANAYLLSVQWTGGSSGKNAQAIIRESPISLLFCLMGPHSSIFYLLWQVGRGGTNASMTVVSSPILILECGLDRNSLFVMTWSAAGHQTVINLNDSPVTMQDTNGQNNATLLALYNPGDAFRLDFGSGVSVYDSSLQSVVEIYSDEVVSLSTVNVSAAVNLYESTLQAVVEIFAPTILSSSYSLLSVRGCNSSAAGFRAKFLPSVSAKAAASSGSWSVSVEGAVMDNCSWIAFALTAPSLSTPISLQLRTARHVISEGSFQSVLLDAISSPVTIDGRIEQLTVRGAVVQLASVNGAAGSLFLQNIAISDALLDHSFIHASLYDVQRSMNISLANVTLSGVSVSLYGSLLYLIGSVAAAFEGGGIDVSLEWYNSSSAVILLEAGVGSPVLLESKGRGLAINSLRYGLNGRQIYSLIAVAAGSTELNGFFTQNSTYDPYDGSLAVEYLPGKQLECPFGYSFRYEIAIPFVFYPPYTKSPFNCLRPFASRQVLSCEAPSIVATAQCLPCPENTVSFFKGTAERAVVVSQTVDYFFQSTEPFSRCETCPSSLLCEGGPADVTVTSKHWSLSLPLLWNVSDWRNVTLDEAIVKCPDGACEAATPLTYLNGLVVKGSLCSSGRDPASPLCSCCAANASAGFLSDRCTESCQWEGKSVAFVVGATILVIGYAAFLLLKPVSPQSPWIRIVTYYYSVLGLLLTSSDNDVKNIVNQVSAAFTSLGFSFSTGSSSSSSSSSPSDICIPGLQPVDVQLIRFAVPAAFIALFSVGYGLKRLVTRRKEGVRLIGGLFSVLLLSYSSISGALFAFLPCVDIPTIGDDERLSLESRLFENAVWPCWVSVPWAVALVIVGLLCIFGLPLALYLWQGLFPSQDRWLHRFVYGRLRVPTKKWAGVTVLLILEGNLRVWYWDAFLFVRRAILEVVAVFATRGIVQQSILLLLNTFFGFMHVAAKPYKSQLANATEAASLFFLVIINALNLPRTFLEDVPISLSPFQSFLATVQDAQSWVSFGGFFVIAVPIVGVYLHRAVVVVRKRLRKRISKKRKRAVTSRFSAMELEETDAFPRTEYYALTEKL